MERWCIVFIEDVKDNADGAGSGGDDGQSILADTLIFEGNPGEELVAETTQAENGDDVRKPCF